MRDKLSYGVTEAARRFVLMVFGVQLFEFPVLRKVRSLVYPLFFDMKNPTFISSHVVINRGHSNVSDFEDGSPRGVLRIGEHVSISADVQIDYCGRIVTGKNVWISEGTRIYTHTHEFHTDRIEYADHTMRPTKLYIGDYAWIGANALILPGVRRIGKNAVIGAGSVVTKSIPDNAVAVGNPARVVRYLDEDERAGAGQV